MADAETTGLRLLVVGVDGACLSVLDPLIDADVVPTLASLREASAVAPLQSQLPPWTPSAWPSIYTGKNPGKHGVYDFLRFDGYEPDVVNRSTVKARAVWELLSMEGYRSVVVNVPVTHPPRPFDGTLVPGYMAPEAPACHPEGTWEELQRELGGYQLYADEPYSEATRGERVDSYRKLIRQRGAAFRYLADDREPDFGFVQFQAGDTVFHEYPDDTEAIRAVYGAVDDEIGRILEACEPELTIVVSDHGLGPMEREFRLNEFLRDRGFVSATTGNGGMPSWSSLASDRLRDGTDDSSGSSVAERALELAARVGITSQRIAGVVKRLGLERQVVEFVPADLIRAGTEHVDFSASTAYLRSRTEMGVRLNVEGREPDGVVPRADYESVRAELIEALSSVRTPDGRPCFEQVLPREAVFEGPYVEAAPDIVTVPAGFDQYLSASLRGEWFADPSEPWEHKREGLVMVAGETIDPTADVRGHIFDIAPTVLAAFGLAVDREMDGDPLPVVPPTGRSRYPRFDPGDPERTDDPAVERRLADLGYLE
ncbi:MAG: alkaline phosphatase family protein [Halohasta sp.]